MSIKRHLRTERLRDLYSVIAGLPRAVVDMSSWRKSGGKDNVRVSDETLLGLSVRHECGTAACALGWAAAYPPFKDAGLRMVVTSCSWLNPAYEGKKDYDAGEKFFGISSGQAYQLFRPVYGADKGTEKGIFLARLRDLLLELEMITPARDAELVAEEAARDLAEAAA